MSVAFVGLRIERKRDDNGRTGLKMLALQSQMWVVVYIYAGPCNEGARVMDSAK